MAAGREGLAPVTMADHTPASPPARLRHPASTPMLPNVKASEPQEPKLTFPVLTKEDSDVTLEIAKPQTTTPNRPAGMAAALRSGFRMQTETVQATAMPQKRSSMPANLRPIHDGGAGSGETAAAGGIAKEEMVRTRAICSSPEIASRTIAGVERTLS